VVLSKRGRNLGPKQTKILVTNLDEWIPRQVVSAQQFPKTRNSKHSSGILTCLFVNRHAKMELSGYE
jgi:hypothetical protein